MLASREVLRWVLLLGFVAMGLLYLNSTMVSLWAAGGPSTETPNAWLHRALLHFGFSVSSLTTGYSIFRVLNDRYIFNGSKTWKVWLLIVVVALGSPPFKKFLEIDSCVDLGGRWIHTHHECEEPDEKLNDSAARLLWSLR